MEASVSGMLGNLPTLNIEDIKGSTNFLRQIFKHKPCIERNRALDCGAGIGRVAKELLCKEFKTVDLLEQDEKFCEKAKENLISTGNLGHVFNVGLQDFRHSGQATYDIIWCQWFLGHLLDVHVIESMILLSTILSPHGYIIVKENFSSSSEPIIDETDSSVTRPLKHFKGLLKKANLRVVKECRQLNFPNDLYPVYMLALKRIK